MNIERLILDIDQDVILAELTEEELEEKKEQRVKLEYAENHRFLLSLNFLPSFENIGNYVESEIPFTFSFFATLKTEKAPRRRFEL